LEGLARVITANFGQRNVPIRLAANILDSAWMREHDRALAERVWEECFEAGTGWDNPYANKDEG
jgi:hypothetical protein